jgi:DnaJ-class molecular chaperone with C-terminal Zn finger domain
MSDNFYKVLGVDEKASKEDIKKSYRTLQMKYHPDRNNNSQDANIMTQKLNEAYETLGDDEKREEYDMTRNNPFAKGMDVPMDDIINMMFGGMGMGGFPGMQMGGFPGMQMGGFPGMPGMQMRGQMGGLPPGTKIHFFQGGNPMNFQQMQKPNAILKNIVIKLSQVLTGANIPLEIERWIMEQGMKVFETETIYVTIPKGIDDGELILLKDKGNVLNETCKGDIKIFVKIENDSMFKRAGLDLVLEKSINLKDALCGFSFEITYINGKSYTLNNNAGNIIPHGFRKIIPNMGLERDQHKGNMVIEFNIQFPEKLSESVIASLKKIEF